MPGFTLASASWKTWSGSRLARGPAAAGAREGGALGAPLPVGERVVEDLERIALGARLDRVEGAVDDALGDRLLAVEHDRVHEFRQRGVPELGMGRAFALR